MTPDHRSHRPLNLGKSKIYFFQWIYWKITLLNTESVVKTKAVRARGVQIQSSQFKKKLINNEFSMDQMFTLNYIKCLHLQSIYCKIKHRRWKKRNDLWMETTTAALIAHTMRKLEPPFKTNPRPRLPFSNKQGNHQNCSFFVSRHLSAHTTGSVTLVHHNKMMSYSNSSLFCKLGFHIGQKCSIRTPFEYHCQGAAICQCLHSVRRSQVW